MDESDEKTDEIFNTVCETMRVYFGERDVVGVVLLVTRNAKIQTTGVAARETIVLSDMGGPGPLLTALEEAQKSVEETMRRKLN